MAFNYHFSICSLSYMIYLSHLRGQLQGTPCATHLT